jgi:hypothetical protein
MFSSLLVCVYRSILYTAFIIKQLQIEKIKVSLATTLSGSVSRRKEKILSICGLTRLPML